MVDRELSELLLKRIQIAKTEIFTLNLDVDTLFPASERTLVSIATGVFENPIVKYMGKILPTLGTTTTTGIGHVAKIVDGVGTVTSFAKKYVPAVMAIGCDNIDSILKLLMQNSNFKNDPRIFIMLMLLDAAKYLVSPAHGLEYDTFLSQLKEFYSGQLGDLDTFASNIVSFHRHLFKNVEQAKRFFTWPAFARVFSSHGHIAEKIVAAGRKIAKNLEKLHKSNKVSSSELNHLKESFSQNCTHDSEIRGCIELLKFIIKRKNGVRQSSRKCNDVMIRLQHDLSIMYEIYHSNIVNFMDFSQWIKSPPLDLTGGSGADIVCTEKHTNRLFKFVRSVDSVSVRSLDSVSGGRPERKYFLQNLDTKCALHLFSNVYYIFHYDVLVHGLNVLRSKILEQNDSGISTIATHSLTLVKDFIKIGYGSLTSSPAVYDMWEPVELETARTEFLRPTRLSNIQRRKKHRDLDSITQKISFFLSALLRDDCRGLRDEIKISINNVIQTQVLQLVYDKIFSYFETSCLTQNEAGRNVVAFYYFIHDASRFVLLVLHQWFPVFLEVFDPDRIMHVSFALCIIFCLNFKFSRLFRKWKQC